MNAEDEAELERLTSILRTIGEIPSVFANADQLLALQKAALALILTFVRGDRVELEEFLTRNEQPIGAEVTVEDVLFHMRDPENIAQAVRDNPALRDQIAKGNFSDGSMGQLLQNALLEKQKRSEAGNVEPLKKPTKD